MYAQQQTDCHFTVLKLYQHLNGEDVLPSSRLFIKELLDTEKCQRYHDLRAVREATSAKLMEAVPSNSLQEALASEEACAEVVARRKAQYKCELLRTLSLRTRAHYYVKDNDKEVSHGIELVALLVGSAIAHAKK